MDALRSGRTKDELEPVRSFEDLRWLLTRGALEGESVRLAMGINGGVVMLGQRTSNFTKAQFAEWIEFLYATAADRDVKLPAWNYETGEIAA